MTNVMFNHVTVGRIDKNDRKDTLNEGQQYYNSLQLLLQKAK